MILPSPDTAFVWRHLAAGAALVCEPLESVAPHFFTSRQWGLGSPGQEGRDGQERQEGQEGQDGRAGQDGRRSPASGWDQVARAIGVPTRDLRRMKQVHGCAAAMAAAAVAPPVADILLAGDSSLALAVQTADCVPLLLADTRTRALAVAHAGWRGMAARVPVVAVQRMTLEFGTRPSNLLVAVGPSIASCCYEVGHDVRAAFAAAGYEAHDLARWFAVSPSVSVKNPPMPGRTLTARPGHWFFDGWAVVRDQLAEAGVMDTRVFFSGLCTGSHPGAFCSYRRDGAAAGRMAGVIRSGARP
jgi:hypothetical protein